MIILYLQLKKVEEDIHPILSGSDREKHKNSTGTTEQQ